MKNILLLIDHLGSGGAQRQLVGLATLLKQNGYNVNVITYYNIPFYKSFLDDNNIPHKVLNNAESKFFRIFKVNNAIRKYNPDVLISYLDTPSIIACICKLLGGKWKLIVSDRNTSQSYSIRQRIKLYFFKFADYIIPNSNSQKEFIIKNCPQLKNKTHVITNFLDTSFFSPLQVSNKRNIIPTILSVGRMAPQKNIPRYAEALCIAKSKGTIFKAKWYGKLNNDIIAECKKISKQYGYENILEFHDAEKNILPIYQSNDIFCLPSLYEGYPNVLCEAMSCGMPILCSRICDNPLIVEESKNGFMFDPQNIQDISSTIINILNLSTQTLDKMGDYSRKLSIEKFSSDIFIKKYLQLIEK